MSTEFVDNRTQSLDNEDSLVHSNVNIGSVSEYLESNVDFVSYAISDKVFNIIIIISIWKTKLNEL